MKISITIPEFIKIRKKKWKIVFDKNMKFAGEFWCKSHIIKINKNLSKKKKFYVFIHEVCEILLVVNGMRLEKSRDRIKTDNEIRSENYLFFFNHHRFCKFTNQLSGILSALIKK